MVLKDIDRQLIEGTFSAVRTMPEFSINPEGLVYHFTDASGLIGIVETNKLWGTRAACLNDAGEVKLGLGLVETILKARTINGSAISKIALSHLSASKPAIVIDHFVVSFCGREPISGQWLHYGRQGLGYAVGFEPQGIMQQGWTTSSVSYDESEQSSRLKLLIERVESEAVSLIRDNCQTSDRAWHEDVAGVALYAALRGLAPCFKHPSFSSEEEWRAFDYHIEGEGIDSGRRKSPKFRASNGRIIPFIELVLPTGNESPIREIVIGYQIDEAVARESISFLLRKAGLPLDKVKIRMSEVALKGNG